MAEASRSKAVLWAVILIIVVLGAIGFVVWRTTQTPNLIVTARFPGNVRFGEVFEMTVIVINTGQVAAENAQLFLRANPAGHFTLRDCDHQSGTLAPNGVVWGLGRLGTGAQVAIVCHMRAPTPVPGVSGYELVFTFAYEGIAERPGARFIIQVGQGVFLFQQ